MPNYLARLGGVALRVFVKPGSWTRAYVHTGYLAGGEPIYNPVNLYTPGHVSAGVPSDDGLSFRSYFSHKPNFGCPSNDPAAVVRFQQRIIQNGQALSAPTLSPDELTVGSPSQAGLVAKFQDAAASDAAGFKLNADRIPYDPDPVSGPRAYDDTYVRSTQLRLRSGLQSPMGDDGLGEQSIQIIDVPESLVSKATAQAMLDAEKAKDAKFSLNAVNGEMGEHCTSTMINIVNNLFGKGGGPRLRSTRSDTPEQFGRDLQQFLSSRVPSGAPSAAADTTSASSSIAADVAALAPDAAEVAEVAPLLLL